MAATVSGRFHRIWLALGWLWVAVVLWLSLTPAPPQPLTFDQSDKLEHAMAYLFLMGWFAVIYRRERRIACAVALVAMGVAVEILQGLSGYRHCDVADMAANGGGVLLGWLMMGRFGDTLFGRWRPPGKMVCDMRGSRQPR